jgi:LysR family transcriptional regulator, glycine cleavage system transcriptional activator
VAAAGVPDLKPAHEQLYEHFYFAIQAALEGLGVMMGPIAVIADELRAGRLLAPIPDPVLRTRGYFFYAPQPGHEAPRIAVLRKWLAAAGSATESEFPAYLSANRA